MQNHILDEFLHVSSHIIEIFHAGPTQHLLCVIIALSSDILELVVANASFQQDEIIKEATRLSNAPGALCVDTLYQMRNKQHSFYVLLSAGVVCAIQKDGLVDRKPCLLNVDPNGPS